MNDVEYRQNIPLVVYYFYEIKLICGSRGIII